MVNISIIENQVEEKITITMSGHAEYAEKGKDIVCASITTIWYEFIELWRMCDHFAENKTTDTERKIVINCKPMGFLTYNVVMKFIKIQYNILKNISDSYPASLSLVISASLGF